jgi:O-antigen ligase
MAYPVVLAAVVAGTFFIRRLRDLVWGSGSGQSSTDARADQWTAGIPKILEQPWGHGLGRGGSTLGWSSGEGALESIDSYYLSLLLELGLAGFVVFIALLVSALFYAIPEALRARDRETSMLVPLVIALLNFALIKSVLSQDANHPLVFLMLGMLVALVFRSRIGNDKTDLSSGSPQDGSGTGLHLDRAIRSSFKKQKQSS